MATPRARAPTTHTTATGLCSETLPAVVAFDRDTVVCLDAVYLRERKGAPLLFHTLPEPTGAEALEVGSTCSARAWTADVARRRSGRRASQRAGRRGHGVRAERTAEDRRDW